MRRLFKVILTFIISIILIVIIFVGFLFSQIIDNSEDNRYQSFSDNMTLYDRMTEVFNYSFAFENKDNLDFTLSEDAINKIIFSYIREHINKHYLESDCKYIKEFTFDTFIGKQKVIIKSVYFEIHDDEFIIDFRLRALGVNTCVKMIASIESDNNNYYITFQNIHLGKLKLFKKKINELLMNIISQAISDNLLFTIDYQKNQVIIEKRELSKILISKVKEGENSKEVAAFIELLANPDNELLNFGIFEKKIGFRCPLERLKVDPPQQLNEISNFNDDLFIKNKVQSFVINSIANVNKITFSNLELNQLIYKNTNQYQDLNIFFYLPHSNSIIAIKVTGMMISLGSEQIELKVYLDINGLPTSATFFGTVYHNDSENLEIRFLDDIIIGEGSNDAKLIKVNIDLMLSSLENIEYFNFEGRSLFLDNDFFINLMAFDSKEIPLELIKITINDGYFETYISTNNINDDLNIVINRFKNLNRDLFASDDFSNLEEGTAFIDDYQKFIDEIQKDEFTNFDYLVNSINNLSKENQENIFRKIENEINSLELTNLYNIMFGK